MIFVTKLMFIILAVSLDGFTVGITYGLRKISITISTLLIIMLCSGFVVFSSMTVGKFVNQFIPTIYATYSGGIIFICLGLFLLFSLIREKIYEKKRVNSSYGIFIKNPTIVDSDNSGTLSLNEAFVLGIALALDAFGAGLAAAMLGFSIIIMTWCIAFASGIFVFLGFQLGHWLAHVTWISRLIYLPPLLLIVIGISSFI